MFNYQCFWKISCSLDELLTFRSIFYSISLLNLSHGVVIFLAFSNIYSGRLFLLTNKKLESAGTCGFQANFRQIALSDALLTLFAIAALSVGKTCH